MGRNSSPAYRGGGFLANLVETFLKWLSAEIFAGFGFLFGGMDGLLTALMVFMIMDYLTGIIIAIKENSLSSETGFYGLAKKGMMLMIVAIGHILDTQIIGGSSMLRSGAAGFFIANEGLSILENAGKLGIPLPKKLKMVLNQLKDENDKKDDKT